MDQTVGWFSESESRNSFAASSDTTFSSQSTSDFSSESESQGESYFESTGESDVPVWVPIPVQELTTESEWTREEKVSKVVEMLKYQQERHCFIKLDNEPTQPLRIPFVREYSQSDKTLLEYERAVYDEQQAVSAADADLLLVQSERKFLQAATNQTPAKPHKLQVDKQQSQKGGLGKGAQRSARSQLFQNLKTNELLSDE